MERPEGRRADDVRAGHADTISPRRARETPDTGRVRIVSGPDGRPTLPGVAKAAPLNEQSVTCVYRAYEDGVLVATGRLHARRAPARRRGGCTERPSCTSCGRSTSATASTSLTLEPQQPNQRSEHATYASSRYRPRVLRGVGAAIPRGARAAGRRACAGLARAQFGIQDDAWLLYGPGTLPERVDDARRISACRRRAVHAPLGPGRAAKPASPRTRTTLRLGRLRRACSTRCTRRASPTLVTLYGSPRWANGGGRPRTCRRPASATSRTRPRRGSRGCTCGPRGTSRTAGPSRCRSRRASTCSASSIRPSRRSTRRRPRTASPAASPRRGRRRPGSRRSRSCRACALRTRDSTRTRRTRIRSSAARRRPHDVVHELQLLHDGEAPRDPRRRDAVLRSEAALAHRVRVSDESARPAARRLVGAAGDLHRRRLRCVSGSKPASRADPVPDPRRAESSGAGRAGSSPPAARPSSPTTRSRSRSRRSRGAEQGDPLGPGAARAPARAPTCSSARSAAPGGPSAQRARPAWAATFTRTVTLPRGTRVRIFAPSVGWASPALTLS